MRSQSFGTLLFIGISLAIIYATAVEAQNGAYPRDGYRHNMNAEEKLDKRMAQLERFLEETMNQLEDHRAGRKLLEDEEFELLSKRKKLVESKIQRMKEMDDSDLERMRRRSERRGGRSEL